MEETEVYITVKDNKKDFPHKFSFRLINPSKSVICKISKTLLDKINKILILNTNVNQWENTTIVIDWFKIFDVPIGCYDGAMICELVGIFI